MGLKTSTKLFSLPDVLCSNIELNEPTNNYKSMDARTGAVDNGIQGPNTITGFNSVKKKILTTGG